MLGDTVAAQLSDFQAHAESMMHDTCTVRRKTGTRFDRATGQTLDVTIVVYSGKCRLRTPDTSTLDVDAGLVAWRVQDVTLSLPVNAGGVVRVGDVATVDTAPLAPWLAGRVFDITSDPAVTMATAARYRCKEAAR